MTTLSLAQRATHQKIRAIHFPKVNWKLFYILGALFFVSMLIYYIFLVNALTKGTYLIRSYNKEVSAISKENRALETNFAETSFLGGVTDKVRLLDFQKTTKVKYIQAPDNSLAQAK